MKIYLASASLDAIRWALEMRFADGVFVTPAILDAEAFGVEAPAHVEAIARVSTSPVLVTVGAVSTDDLHRGAREFARIADHVVAALPFMEDGIAAVRRLAPEGVTTAATFIVTPAQALLAAKAGAAFVCLATDELESHGHDPILLVREVRAVFDRLGIESDIVAMAPHSPHLLAAAFAAGADGVVVNAETLRGLVKHPLTDRAVDQMLGELSRRPRPRARKGR